jgi:hypothetical protein
MARTISSKENRIMGLSELHKKISLCLDEHYPHEMTNQAAVDIGEIIKEEIDKEIVTLQDVIRALEYFKTKFQLTND